VFQVGDTVIKPSIGICRIKAIRRLQIEDRSEAYYVIQAGDVDVLVPKKLADSGALRPPMNEESLKKIYEALEAPYRTYPVDPGEDLPEAYRFAPADVKAKLKKRDPAELVEIVRNLHNKEHDYVLVIRKHRSLTPPRKIICWSEEDVTFLENRPKGVSRPDRQEALLRAARKRKIQAAKILSCLWLALQAEAGYGPLFYYACLVPWPLEGHDGISSSPLLAREFGLPCRDNRGCTRHIFET
jgi:RNA polymerase-interacting CarD/CdnL/TRCF family regulator